MPVDLFLQHHRLPQVPEGALAGITTLAAGIGLRTHWDEAHRALYIDSPLHNRIVACLAAAVYPPNPLADRVIDDLSRRIQAAGGLTAIPGSHPADVSIHFQVNTGMTASETGPALAVWHGWLPQSRRLGERVAASLAPATGLPVRVATRWNLWGRHLRIHLSVPAPGACDHLARKIAEGIWSGIMAFLSRRRDRPITLAPPATLPEAGTPPLTEQLPPPPAAAGVPVHPYGYNRAGSARLTPGGVSYRTIRPGFTTASPVYVWTWSVSPYEWEVIRPQPAPAADTPPPTEAAEADPPAGYQPSQGAETTAESGEGAESELAAAAETAVCDALVPSP